jgi:SAM-dependent methyltransferase
VRSLNPRWALNDFHVRIANLANIRDGDRVLDLGCGRGDSLPHLVARIGMTGEIVAADRHGGSLTAIKEVYPEEIAARRLSIVELDISRTLPFSSASFDSVVCQNVVECVSDRDGLVREIHRILKPQGSALIGHHDFDGVLIASDDRELTRRLVHGYADHTQKWQDASEGQMGRLLPGLIANSPFSEAETETLLFVDLALSKESYARDHLEGIVALSERFGVSAESAKAWLHSMEARSDSGAFYYAMPWTYVIARNV